MSLEGKVSVCAKIWVSSHWADKYFLLSVDPFPKFDTKQRFDHVDQQNKNFLIKHFHLTWSEYVNNCMLQVLRVENYSHIFPPIPSLIHHFSLFLPAFLLWLLCLAQCLQRLILVILSEITVHRGQQSLRNGMLQGSEEKQKKPKQREEKTSVTATLLRVRDSEKKKVVFAGIDWEINMMKIWTSTWKYLVN